MKNEQSNLFGGPPKQPEGLDRLDRKVYGIRILMNDLKKYDEGKYNELRKRFHEILKLDGIMDSEKDVLEKRLDKINLESKTGEMIEKTLKRFCKGNIRDADAKLDAMIEALNIALGRG